MKTEYTFNINGFFKFLCSEKEKELYVSAIKNKIANTLCELEKTGVINSYGREYTGNGSWAFELKELKD